VRLKLISCEIFYREMCAAVARSPHLVDIEFLPKGLHDIGSAGRGLRARSSWNARHVLQARADSCCDERREGAVAGQDVDGPD